MRTLLAVAVLTMFSTVMFGDFTPVPIDKLCNRDLIDNTPEGDGKGGWTDQGKENSLTGFPRGKVKFEGIPFSIPKSGNAAVMFGGKKLSPSLKGLASEVSVDVPKSAKGGNVYLLALSVWGAPENIEAAKVTVTYANGEKEDFSLKYQREIADWWSGAELPKAVFAWRGENGAGANVGVYLVPLTAKYVLNSAARKINIKANTAADPSLVILGITVGDKIAKKVLPSPLAWKDWSGNSTEGWFTITSKYDDASQPAPWETSFDALNRPAGSLGWTLAKGENFEFAKAPGKPVRFKGVTACGSGFFPFTSQAEQYAKILKKYGFNQIRFHSIFDTLLVNKGGYIVPELNEARMKKFDKYFSELKKAGIYVRASALFSGKWAKETGVEAFDKIPSLNNTQYTFDEKHQELYLKSLKLFLEHKNPFTGLKYAEDPAFHMFKVVNESSLFFNSPIQFPGYYNLKIQDKYNNWLKNKYGNDIKLRDAWQVKGEKNPLASSESLTQGTISLMATHSMANCPKYKVNRAMDQTKFYYETENAWFQKVYKLVRSTGSKALVQGSSWGGPGYLQEIQSAVNANLDYHGKHTYWLHPHGGWVAESALFPNLPIVKHPKDHLLQGAYQHISGKPFVITEWNFCFPNDYSLDAAPFMAIYGALQNIAANNRFVIDLPELGTRKRDFFSMFNSPTGLAVEPMSYYLYVRGDLQTAPVIYRNSIAGNKLHDPLRKKGVKANISENRFYMLFDPQTIPMEAMLVGGVRLTLDEKKYPPIWDEKKFKSCFDEKNKTVKSVTDEILWNYGKGFILVKTPKTRGILGFLDGDYDNGPLKMDISKAYGVVNMSSIDNLPLEKSSKILLTVTGRERNSGQTLQELCRDGKKIDKYESVRMGTVGGPPLIYEPLELNFSLKTDQNGKWNLVPLDLAGRKKQAKSLNATGGVLKGQVSNKEFQSLNFILEKQ